MQQLAIFHTEAITRKGEIKYFQIPLPGKHKKIIAIESSAVRLPDSLPVFTSNLGTAFMSASLFMAPTDTLQNVEGDGGGGGGGTTNTGSGSTGSAPYNACPNPGKATIEVVSESTLNGVRTQVFRIGAAVNPGFVYSCGVYSVVVSVTAVDGDTPTSIAAKLASAVNATSLSTWSQYGSNTRNYKPTGNASGDQLTLTTDSQHSFFAAGTGECSVEVPPPPPPPPQVPTLMAYDPLFFILNNEKAGTLSLQSPDATDIFFQAPTYREDKNIGYGDFTRSGESVGEWIKGKKRYATEILITTESPLLEAYYKDGWGAYHGRDIRYHLNIIIWYEKEKK